MPTDRKIGFIGVYVSVRSKYTHSLLHDHLDSQKYVFESFG